MAEDIKTKIKNYKTAPFDSRFPNQNQTKNCWQNYLDFHRCEKAMTAKGGDVSVCEWYRRVYKSLCPVSWYLLLMLIVYIFECASCITSYTHRDYMVSNPSLITKQMLTYYSADTDQGQELTRLWDRIMIEQECCGTSGPMDWVNYTSAFRAATPEVVFPWPPLCCRRTGNFIPINEDGCRVGHMDYLFTKGCFEHIGHAIDSYTWGISWFGFAILMWTLPVMLIAMYFYTTL